MKRNNELERSDIAIDRDMEVDCDKGQQITCYVETWFDVDKKFRIHTDADAGTWLNMYARYDPYEDTLRIDCVISSDDGESTFEYEPTQAEAQLIKELITQTIQEVHNQTPTEFCEAFQVPAPTLGGLQ